MKEIYIPSGGEYLVVTHPISLSNAQAYIHLRHKVNQRDYDMIPNLEPLDCFKIKSVFMGKIVFEEYNTVAVIGLKIPHVASFLSRLPKDHRLLSRAIYATYEELKGKSIVFAKKEDADSYIDHIKNPDGGVPVDTLKDRFSAI